ncbi:MAG: hypothetical protein MZW92_57175 [Comamonadaceae bacterium]|nr:hypothetical protein [Comamonadaceae bacterium]
MPREAIAARRGRTRCCRWRGSRRALIERLRSTAGDGDLARLSARGAGASPRSTAAAAHAGRAPGHPARLLPAAQAIAQPDVARARIEPRHGALHGADAHARAGSTNAVRCAVVRCRPAAQPLRRSRPGRRRRRRRSVARRSGQLAAWWSPGVRWAILKTS